MKLHLPKMLTAALLAAFAVTGAFATTTTTTTYSDGTVFNGDIWTWNNAGDGTSVSNASSRYTNYTTQQTYAGNADIPDVGKFWQVIQYSSEQSYVGNTLRFADYNGDIRLNTDYNAWVWVGGIITEAGNSGTYTLGRNSSDIRLKGNHDVNMIIKSNFTLMSGTGRSTEIMTGGTWDVATGKVLTFSGLSLTQYAEQTVKITGSGTVTFDTAYTGQAGALFNVGEGATLNFAKAAQLGGTITNAGTVTFGGAVSLTDSLSGFESVENGHYVDYTGTEAPNGYYQGTTDYTLVKGNAASGLTSVTHGDQQYTVTDGKITVGSASDIDKTTYHLRTSGTSVNVGTELANNSQLVKVVQNADTTVDLGGATLATLEGATSGAAMKIAGTGTISALTKTGVLDMQSGASVTVPNLTVADAMGTYSTGAGKLVMETVNLNANSSQIEFDSATQITTAQLTGGAITFGGSGITHSVTNLKLSQEGQRVSTVNVEAGTTLHITGTAVSDTQPNRFAGSFSVSHWNAANVLNVNGTLISEAVVSSCDGTATINVNSGGRLEMRDGLNRGNYNNNAITINVASGATLAAGTTHNTTQTKNSDTMVVNMAAGSIFEAYYGNGDTAIINKTLTFDGGISSINTGAAAGKAMILNSNLSTDANLFVYGEGELRLAGGNNVLGHAIGLYSGTLSMTGTFNIDALQVQGEQTEWVRTDGIAEGSGFKKVSGTVTVVSIEDGTLNAAGAIVTRNGVAVSLADTGVATLSGTANYTALWVNNTGAASYAAAQTLADTTTVETVHLNAEGATITMDKANASVALVLSEGINGGVNATAATTLSSVTGLGDGQTLTITGTELVTLGSAVTGNKVVVDNGKVDLGALTHTLSALEITNGSTAVVSGLDSDKGCVSGTISIGAGSVLTVHGHHDAFGYHEATATQKIVMGGTDSDHKAVLELNPTIQNAGTVTMTTDIEMNGYAAITTTVKGFNTYDCSITATGVENSIDQMYLRNAVTITVNGADGELTIGKLQRTPNFDGALTKEGEGKLVFNGTENVLDKAIIVNAGTLALDGTFAIDDIEHTGDTYSYTGGEVQGNGFLTTIAKRTVVTGDGYVDAENALFTVGGEEAQYENGVVTSTTTDNTSFWVFSGTEKVSTAKRQEDLQNISVYDGKLLVDEDYDSASISAVMDIIDVEIAGNATLNGTGENMKLSGAGTYALDNATTALGTGVTLDQQAWTGTVALSGISGAAGNNLNLNSYGHEGSKVAMDGVSGYFLQAQAVFAPELVLEGAGLTLNNGFSTMPSGNPKPPTTYTFAGGVSGEGDMTFNRPAVSGASTVTQHLYFTGDVMNWTGSLNVVSLFNVYAQYSGADQKVNSTISRTGGELHVEVGTGSDASVVTFSKAITADDLTVKAGATAYINGGLTTSTITVDEGATLAINGNTTLTSAITSAGTVTLTNVALSDAFTETPGGEAKYYIEETQNYYMGSADKYLTVVTGDGAANATGTGLTWNTLTGLEMANGQVITGAGEANYSTLFVGGDTTSADIVGYGHKDALTSIVVESGTLTLTEGELPQTVAITVSEHGTIAGDVTPTLVEIAEGATAEFTKPVTGNHYTFSAAEDGTVAVTNSGEAAAYTGGNRDMTVVADTLEAPDAWEEVTISNIVKVKNVVAGEAAILTLDNVDGTLDLQNLEIGSMAFVQVYASGEHLSENEATVVISETLTAGLGSTLNADLTMKGGSTLDLDGSNGIAALTLGSTLTLDTADGLVNLGEDIISYLSNMQVGESVDLFKHGYGTSLDYGDEYEGAYYDALFVRTDALVGDFTVYADGDHFGLTKCNNVPEPTTGTLSLLALAALAARRRRH